MSVRSVIPSLGKRRPLSLSAPSFIFKPLPWIYFTAKKLSQCIFDLGLYVVCTHVERENMNINTTGDRERETEDKRWPCLHFQCRTANTRSCGGGRRRRRRRPRPCRPCRHRPPPPPRLNWRKRDKIRKRRSLQWPSLGTSDLPARIWATAISGGSIAPDGTQTGEVSKDKLDIKIRIITMHSEVMITEWLICTDMSNKSKDRLRDPIL